MMTADRPNMSVVCILVSSSRLLPTPDVDAREGSDLRGWGACTPRVSGAPSTLRTTRGASPGRAAMKYYRSSALPAVLRAHCARYPRPRRTAQTRMQDPLAICAHAGPHGARAHGLASHACPGCAFLFGSVPSVTRKRAVCAPHSSAARGEEEQTNGRGEHTTSHHARSCWKRAGGLKPYCGSYSALPAFVGILAVSPYVVTAAVQQRA